MRAFPIALVIVFSVYTAGFLLFVLRVQQPVPPPKPADGIVALTGGEQRVSAAVGLLEHRVAQRLLITGVHPETTKAEIRELAHGGARFDCCADLGFAAADTHGNAQETAEWARAHHYRSLIVVTANYHMPRSLNEFSAAMPGVTLEPYPVQPEEITLQDWWRRPHSLQVLNWEFVKYLASLAMTILPHREPDVPDADADADMTAQPSH